MRVRPGDSVPKMDNSPYSLHSLPCWAMRGSLPDIPDPPFLDARKPVGAASSELAVSFSSNREDRMPTFICSLSWTDQGLRSVKDAPKRAKASRELASKLGVEVKQVYLTSGSDDLVVIVDTPTGTTSPNGPWHSAPREMCVLEPPEPGQSPNS